MTNFLKKLVVSSLVKEIEIRSSFNSRNLVKVLTPETIKFPQISLKQNFSLEELSYKLSDSEILPFIASQVIEEEEKSYFHFLADILDLGFRLQKFSNGFTSTVVAKLRAILDNTGNVAPQNLFIAANLLQNLPTFGQATYLSYRYEEISSGNIGNVLGLKVYSDTHKTPRDKVLESGELFIIARPKDHGKYCSSISVEDSIITIETVMGDIDPKSFVKGIINTNTK